MSNRVYWPTAALAAAVFTGVAGVAIGDERHGFSVEETIQKHQARDQERDSSLIDPRGTDAFEALRQDSRNRGDTLREFADRSDETVRTGTSFDSSGRAVEADTGAYWASIQQRCVDHDGLWEPETQSCTHPAAACEEMGFEWDQSSKSCSIPEGSVLVGGGVSPSPAPLITSTGHYRNSRGNYRLASIRESDGTEMARSTRTTPRTLPAHDLCPWNSSGRVIWTSDNRWQCWSQ